jgi:hypothetical protein
MMESQNLLIGAWKLKSFEIRSIDDEVSYPFGRDSKGILIMTANGYWSVAVMGANRRQFLSGDVLGGSSEEKAAAAETYISYSGPYEIRGNKVVVHPEVSFFPNWVGKDIERFFELEGDILDFRTSPMLIGGRQQTAHLVWERLRQVQINL